MNANLENKINEYAIAHGYNEIKYIGNWKNYKVYTPYMSNDEISYVGLPLVILVSNESEIRMSTSDEAMSIIDNLEIDSMIQNINNKILNELECPFCKSTELLKYMYGEPASIFDETKYISGGCIKTGNDPKYKCKKCGKDIYLNDMK